MSGACGAVWRCGVLASALMAPMEAAAQAPAAATPAVDAKAEGQRLFDAGSAAYNLGKYAEAIADFEAAYALLKAPSLLYNLGQAHAKAYELDRDVAHLRQAKILFGNFVKIRESAGESTADAPARIVALDEQIAASERAVPPPIVAPPPTTTPAPARSRPGARTWVGAGLLAGGALGGAAMVITGLVSRARLVDQQAGEGALVPLSRARADEFAAQQGKAAALAYAGIGVGAALIVTGVALIVSDAVRRGRPARAQASTSRAQASTSRAQASTPRWLGAGLVVNF